MPVYPYHCIHCGADFEVEQKITEDPLKSCVECGWDGVVRQIGPTSFVLKGGGWTGKLGSS